jgi:hypothetical protein
METVVISKKSALVGNPADIQYSAPHHAAMVSADIPNADVIGHDDDDVGLLLVRASRANCE